MADVMSKYMQDGKGNKSSSRAVMVYGTAWVLIVWGVISLVTWSIDAGATAAAGSLIAILAGQKVIGKKLSE